MKKDKKPSCLEGVKPGRNGPWDEKDLTGVSSLLRWNLGTNYMLTSAPRCLRTQRQNTHESGPEQ